MNEIELRLRAGGGVIDRRSHRDLSGHIDRLVRTGRLTALLPAVYCLSAQVDDLDIRLRAAVLWAGPDAVLTGYSAARLTFWPSRQLPHISVALPTQSRRSLPGVEVECRRIPEWLVQRRGPLRLTVPALTAVDLAAGPDGGDAIDRVLLTREGSLGEMWEALRAQPHRRHNKQRARLLHDSRDEPWSAAERLQHRLLRGAGLTGWGSNRWVAAGGDNYVVDVLFRRERLVLEVDGWETHGGRQSFESDRRRRNHLVLAGYRVLNFTWRQLVDEPDWVISCIRTALAGDAFRYR